MSAGGAHSAAITTLGRLYTWGKGRYGRLGHGDYDDQLKPKMVEALKTYKVTQVCFSYLFGTEFRSFNWPLFEYTRQLLVTSSILFIYPALYSNIYSTCTLMIILPVGCMRKWGRSDPLYLRGGRCVVLGGRGLRQVGSWR